MVQKNKIIYQSQNYIHSKKIQSYIEDGSIIIISNKRIK